MDKMSKDERKQEAWVVYDQITNDLAKDYYDKAQMAEDYYDFIVKPARLAREAIMTPIMELYTKEVNSAWDMYNEILEAIDNEGDEVSMEPSEILCLAPKHEIHYGVTSTGIHRLEQ